MCKQFTITVEQTYNDHQGYSQYVAVLSRDGQSDVLAVDYSPQDAVYKVISVDLGES